MENLNILSLLAGIVISFIIFFLIKKILFKKEYENIEKKNTEFKTKIEFEIENKKKKMQSELNEEFIGWKNEYNRKQSQKINKLNDQEKRLIQKEENLDKRYINLDNKEKEIKKSEKDLFYQEEELKALDNLTDKYTNNIAPLSNSEYKKELEILAIDLSWKSGEIEGNTYTLLETEALIKYKELAEGKKQEDAIMLLNHKDALDFIIAEPDYLKPLTISRIEDIHSLLIKNLGVERSIRKRGVGVGGTEYKPLSLEQQIAEVMQQMCDLVNATDNVFEKALLLLVLLSYIQPFNDGNKRTARIISNAILMENSHCPLSYRSVKASDYKKAMLLFYEQNNITEFKKIFMSQYEYAVNKYFNLDPEAAE